MSGWLVTDLVSSSQLRSQQDTLGGRHQISINSSAVVQRLTSQYYWSAPEAYLGNKVLPGPVSGAEISEHIKEDLVLAFQVLSLVSLEFSRISHSVYWHLIHTVFLSLLDFTASLKYEPVSFLALSKVVCCMKSCPLPERPSVLLWVPGSPGPLWRSLASLPCGASCVPVLPGV